MNDFFRNIKINIEEFFEKLKFTDKKAIVASVVSIVLIIVTIISVSCIVKERKKPAYSLDKTINGYVDNYIKFDYYKAYDYTVIGKKGVDKYIEDNYLSELSTGEVDSEDAMISVNSLTAAYSTPFFNKASQSGYNDCDALFSWYFESAIDATLNTEIKDYATKKVMLLSFKQVLEAYKIQADEKLKEEYIGYDLKAEESKVTEFTDEEVELYKGNKSDKAKTTFNNADLDYNKISAVQRHDFDIIINSETVRTMSVYVIKIGQKWYVDNTALI